MYSYVTRMYSYVIRMYSHVTRLLLEVPVCSFSHDRQRYAVLFHIHVGLDAERRYKGKDTPPFQHLVGWYFKQ